MLWLLFVAVRQTPTRRTAPRNFVVAKNSVGTYVMHSTGYYDIHTLLATPCAGQCAAAGAGTIQDNVQITAPPIGDSRCL